MVLLKVANSRYQGEILYMQCAIAKAMYDITSLGEWSLYSPTRRRRSSKQQKADIFRQRLVACRRRHRRRKPFALLFFLCLLNAVRSKGELALATRKFFHFFAKILDSNATRLITLTR